MKYFTLLVNLQVNRFRLFRSPSCVFGVRLLPRGYKSVEMDRVPPTFVRRFSVLPWSGTGDGDSGLGPPLWRSRSTGLRILSRRLDL